MQQMTQQAMSVMGTRMTGSSSSSGNGSPALALQYTHAHPPSCNCIVPPTSLLKPLAEILLYYFKTNEQNNSTVICVSTRRGLSRYSQRGHSVLRLDTAEQVATLIVATAHDSLVMGAAAVVHVGLIVGGDGARVGEGHVRLGLTLAALSQ